MRQCSTFVNKMYANTTCKKYCKEAMLLLGVRMELSLTEKLGYRIKELRIARNLKQCELADKLNMERSNLTRIENGKQRPSDENLEKIAKILKVEIKELFDFGHIKSRDELIDAIDKQLQELTSKELEYFHKSLINYKIIKNL